MTSGRLSKGEIALELLDAVQAENVLPGQVVVGDSGYGVSGPLRAALARTHIQLRAWSQLLAAEAGVVCHCWEVPHRLGNSLEDNVQFLGGLLYGPNRIVRSTWCLDDYEFSFRERAQMQADSVSVHVAKFLQLNGLA